jgi:hypothetical protein
MIFDFIMQKQTSMPFRNFFKNLRHISGTKKAKMQRGRTSALSLSSIRSTTVVATPVALRGLYIRHVQVTGARNATYSTFSRGLSTSRST